MKRIGQNIWEDICLISNIQEAFCNSLNLRKKLDLKLFNNMDECVENIHKMLVNETYKFSPLRHIIVHDPKERIIDYAVTYPDKILINCVLNVLKDRLIPKYIKNTYSSIKGRGLHLCANKIKKTLELYPNSYYILTDILKYYPGIDQDLCKKEFRKYIKDKKCLKFLDTLLSNHNLGIPIGISIGSYEANLFLTRFDRWVYDELKPLAYVRYMDDLLSFFETKEQAKDALMKIKEKIKEFKLIIKDNVKIAPSRCGINIIGYQFYLTHTKLKKRIKNNMKKKAKKLEGVSDKIWKQLMASYYGWCVHANCVNLMKKTFKERYSLFNNYGNLKNKRS